MDWKDKLAEIKNSLIEQEEVFEAIRRGYSELNNASNDEILDYFKVASFDELKGHISNIKGILFEQEVQDKLTQNRVENFLFEKTNHPDSDMIINGEEVQLKATENTSYINQALSENPDIAVVATSEVASSIDNENVIDSGISDAILEEAVIETISPISKTGLLLGGIGLFFGLFF